MDMIPLALKQNFIDKFSINSPLVGLKSDVK
nr:MAG TPA: hypothetical protein [Caudoviricetes sp.]